MCLGIPGRITELRDGPLRTGTVDFDGVTRTVCLACEPDAQVGDYVLVHVGFAISRIDEAEAHRTLEALRELGQLEEELGPERTDP
ncbi:MAG: HypC/HybG/HupF family hydrogenase formation chaperone [Phycisphaerales bacterium]|nr:HypC/HybG/HupF family hydrogenase formation chaperone [Phycisphaerae bacterium]NNF43404.1 HypC/HybG/HupF family hydrogenase formation chaperone [Phycisphaerales bacterium]NNM26736.1 HypC/HybG/HupF family hydrogenase formation chaperone [Phycisphaerales bacterium]